MQKKVYACKNTFFTIHTKYCICVKSWNLHVCKKCKNVSSWWIWPFLRKTWILVKFTMRIRFCTFFFLWKTKNTHHFFFEKCKNKKCTFFFMFFFLESVKLKNTLFFLPNYLVKKVRNQGHFGYSLIDRWKSVLFYSSQYILKMLTSRPPFFGRSWPQPQPFCMIEGGRLRATG